MSLLKSKNGIRCDTCGMTFTDVFVYYSCDGVGYTVDFNNRMHRKNGTYINFDMCQHCCDKYKKIILKHVKDAKKDMIKDDFSDEFYKAVDYMVIELTEVDVDKDRDDSTTTKEDIDIKVAGKSLKEFLSKILETKKNAAEEKDEWTTKS